MSHRSKMDVTRRRCTICGVTRWETKGARTTCPYLALHPAAEQEPASDSEGD